MFGRSVIQLNQLNQNNVHCKPTFTSNNFSPSDNTQRMARVRLDIMNILFERRLFLKMRCRRFLMVDSSPQLGHNFLCVREDRIMIPRATCLGSDFRVHFDINQNFESRLCPLSTLGLGHAGMVKKLLNVAGIYLMESADAAQFHHVRNEVRGYTSDQGTEKELAEGTVMVIPRFKDFDPSDVQSFMYPRCLTVPGHLHILYNALESAVAQLPVAKQFLEHLKVLESFLSNRTLRAKFQASCVQGQPCCASFSSYATVHIEWRWEFLSLALDKLVPLFSDMQQHFSASKMLASESGILQSKVIKQVEVVLATPCFVEFAELLRVTGKTIERTAHKLEGCLCHRDVWTAKGSWVRKRKRMLALTGQPTCIWKGRQGPWFVVEGRRTMLHDLEHGSSERLSGFMQALPEGKLASFLGLQQALRSALIETLTQKFEFWDFIPWKAVGIFSCCCGGDLSTSRTIASECVRQYDDAVRAGSSSSMHRLAHLMFSPTTLVRSELNGFIGSDARLEEYPTAFATLQEYSLVSLVERRIEQVHSMINRFGKQCSYVLPPYVCAHLRCSASLALLRSNAEFHQLCLDRWRSRTLLDDVLQLRFEPHELKAMTRLQKIKMIYQCSLESEFADTRQSRDFQAHWRQVRPDTKQAAAALPGAWQTCSSYWKNAFEKHNFYSMSRELWDACVGHEFNSAACPDPVAAGLTAILTSPDDINISSDLCFFQVVNAWPERRSYVSVGHHPMSRWTVKVSRFYIMASRSEEKHFVLFKGEGSELGLDVRGLIASMRTALVEVVSWTFAGRRATWRPKAPLNQGSTDLDVYVQASIADVPMALATSSGSGDCAVLEMRDFIAEQQALACLSERQQPGQDGLSTVTWSSIDGVHWSTVEALARMGAIVVQQDEFGESQVGLNPSGLELCALHSVLSPVPICHVRLSCPPLLMPKFEWLLLLCKDGFAACPKLQGSWQPGSLHYCDGAHPVSYYAALALRQSILDKGVNSIRHRFPDAYYKALILLPGARLANMIASMDGMKSVWFCALLKDSAFAEAAVQHPEEINPNVAEGEVLLSIADRAMDVVHDLVPAIVSSSAWSR